MTPACRVAVPGALLLLTAATALAGPAGPPCQAGTSAPRLDHVVLAVADLEAASARCAALGFRLKRGRLHANGLLNRHIKFSDGTSLELMTVSGPPSDGMARDYAARIAAGGGGAHVALRLESLDRVETIARRLGLAPRRSASGAWRFVGFAPGSPAGAVFFVAGGRPAVDPDSLLAHADGSRALAEVRLEGGPELVRLVEALGGVPCPGTAGAGDAAERRVALASGTLVIVPRAQGSGPARVLGATLRTSDPRADVRPPDLLSPGFRIDRR